MLIERKVIQVSLIATFICTLLFAVSSVQAMSNLEDGRYSVQFKTLKENNVEESRMQQSIDPIGILTVKDGIIIATITMKDSSDITQFKVEQNGALSDVKTVSADQDKNTRTVEFEVSDLTSPVKAWVSIYIELPGFLYDQNYDIQLKFDPTSLKKDDTAQPTVDSSSINLLLYLFKKEAFSNGNSFSLTEAPYLKSDYTMVPVRFISENFGARVDWNENTRAVTISHQNKTLQLKNGSQQVLVNGNTLIVDTAVEIKNGSTFVPLRFIAEQLGAEVKWDPNQKSITIVR